MQTIRIGGEELWIDNVCFGSFGLDVHDVPAALSAMAQHGGATTIDLMETFVDFDQPPFPTGRNGRSLLARLRAT